MRVTWTKLDGDEWGVRLTDPSYPDSTWPGLEVTVTSKGGKKKRVVLGEHVKSFRIKGGRWVAIFRVDEHGYTSNDPYAHWNEEGPIIKAMENDYDSPYADMSDADIKQAVYDRMRDDDDY